MIDNRTVINTNKRNSIATYFNSYPVIIYSYSIEVRMSFQFFYIGYGYRNSRLGKLIASGKA